MDRERVRIAIDYLLIVAGFIGLVVALVGELRGWWNDVGVVLGTLSLAAMLAGVIDVNGRALRGAFMHLTDRIEGLHEKANDHREALVHQTDTLDDVRTILDERLPRRA